LSILVHTLGVKDNDINYLHQMCWLDEFCELLYLNMDPLSIVQAFLKKDFFFISCDVFLLGGVLE